MLRRFYQHLHRKVNDNYTHYYCYFKVRINFIKIQIDKKEKITMPLTRYVTKRTFEAFTTDLPCLSSNRSIGASKTLALIMYHATGRPIVRKHGNRLCPFATYVGGGDKQERNASETGDVSLALAGLRDQLGKEKNRGVTLS
ncbi:hypothetical protein [Pectobacterium sp. CFBP8739]|uniref:hypothetical protein n=1 Tax=Pectobacterium sp. CFBP8739 TaxID=2748908 RepID=UPI0015DF3B67|nr:hypothetical protein [Pectobacterium sp. CFBP8739]MBA0168768.1 hypothetical protein [Pectobacterium sp. CFBP8739]